MSSQRIGRLINTLAKVLRRWLPRHGPVRRCLRQLRSRLPSDQPDTPVSVVIDEFGRAFPDAVFVQIGANDGVLYDPMRRQILRRRWRGVMVEPVPEIYARLQHNYRDLYPRVRLDNVAVSATPGQQPFYHLAQVSDPVAEGLPVWYHALGSFHKDVVLSHREHIPDIDERLVQRMVPCVTVQELCERHGLERVDLVQSDTEGHDFEVIKLLNLEQLRPKLLLYEHHHLGSHDRDACKTLLHNNGYECMEYGYDTLAINFSQLGAQREALSTAWQRARSLLEGGGS